MHVASESASELVLEHRPVVIPAVAMLLVANVLLQTLRAPTPPSGTEWAGVVLGSFVGLLIAYLSSLRTRVVFEARRREVHWHHIGWPGQTRGACSFDDVTGVEVVSSEGGGAQRITLRTNQGAVPLMRGFFGFHRQHQTVTVIQEWLRRHGGDSPAT